MTFEEMRKLPKGWDSYNADPPNDLAVANARPIVDALNAAGEPIRIIPSACGGVAVLLTRSTRERYADFEAFNEGGVAAILSIEGEEPEVWELVPGDSRQLAAAVKAIMDRL